MSENTLPGFFFRSTSCCFFSVSSTIKKITLRSMNITMTMMIIRTSHNHLYKNIFKKKKHITEIPKFFYFQKCKKKMADSPAPKLPIPTTATQRLLGFPNICGSSQELGKPAKARSASGVASSIRSAAACNNKKHVVSTPTIGIPINHCWSLLATGMSPVLPMAMLTKKRWFHNSLCSESIGPLVSNKNS